VDFLTWGREGGWWKGLAMSVPQFSELPPPEERPRWLEALLAEMAALREENHRLRGSICCNSSSLLFPFTSAPNIWTFPW